MLKSWTIVAQFFYFFIVVTTSCLSYAYEQQKTVDNSNGVYNCNGDKNCVKIKSIKDGQSSVLVNKSENVSINKNKNSLQAQSLKNKNQKHKKEIIKDVKTIKGKKNKNNLSNKVRSRYNVFLDDKIIINLINEKQDDVAPVKKILVNVKNRGVPEKCILKKVNNTINNATNNAKTNNNNKKKDDLILKEAKNNLKMHIEQSLIANNINDDLVKYIHKHLKYNKNTLKKHTSNITRKSIDFINAYNVSDRIKIGKLYKKVYNRSLSEIENLFDVDAEAILMIWGLETLYGSFIGNSNAFEALYSACINAENISRLKYFEKNLIFLAKLVDYGYFDKNVVSSFDGGLGGCQFMPESFYNFAVSYKGKKADIINNNEDVFASIANYLHTTGWRYKEGILTEIEIPKNLDSCLIGMNTVKTVAEWKALGVKLNKNNIGSRNMIDTANASIIVTDQNDSDDKVSGRRAFLVYDNYKVIMGYNGRISYGLIAGIVLEGLLS